MGAGDNQYGNDGVKEGRSVKKGKRISYNSPASSYNVAGFSFLCAERFLSLQCKLKYQTNGICRNRGVVCHHCCAHSSLKRQ